MNIHTIGLYFRDMTERVGAVGFRKLLTYRLSGKVQVDESFVRTPRKHNVGRIVRNRSYTLVINSCVGPQYYFREVLGLWDPTQKVLVATRIPDRSSATMTPLIKYWCLPGIEIVSDAWPGYNNLQAEGFRHVVVVHK